MGLEGILNLPFLRVFRNECQDNTHNRHNRHDRGNQRLNRGVC